MAEAPEFSCPHSPDPDNPSCVPGERCFWATKFESEASHGRQFSYKGWTDLFSLYKNGKCAQPRLRNRLMGVIDRLMQNSGHLI